MNITAKYITVKGKVQGVFYRKFTKQKAIELALTGWVRNADNGDVEIFAQGNGDAIEQLSAWCWQGSPKADVKNIEVKNVEPDANFTAFFIQH